MKAELRIGNHIGQGEVMEIKENVVRVKYTADKERTSLIRYEDIHPILLSEEVLLRCPEIQPSTWMPEMWTIRDTKSQFHIVKMKGRFVFRGLGMSVTYVDTLHHLQNLVYVVSGEELEVKWD